MSKWITRKRHNITAQFFFSHFFIRLSFFFKRHLCNGAEPS